MQDTDEAYLRPQVFGVPGEGVQRLSRTVEEQGVRHRPVVQHQRVQVTIGQREHRVVVVNRQHILQTGLHPLLLVAILTLGTVAVAARVVREVQVATPVTFHHVSAQRRRPHNVL